MTMGFRSINLVMAFRVFCAATLFCATTVFCLTTVFCTSAFGQKRGEEFPGSVRMDSGMILSGICSYSKTFHPLLLPQRLEMRRIDQEFRTYFVHTSKSSASVGSDLLVPDYDLLIPQRRLHARPMQYEIGLHRLSDFGSDGRRVMELSVANDKSVKISLGLSRINFQRLYLRSLSHNWEYGIGMDSVSDAQLYAGKEAPGLIKLATQFSEPLEKLNMVTLLMRAQKFAAARQLLADIVSDHPELEPQTNRLVDTWNDQVGRFAITELERLQLTARKQTARIRSRNWPVDQLSATIRVSLQEVDQTVSKEVERLDLLLQALAAVRSEVQGPELKRQAGQLHDAIVRQLDLNNLNQMDAFELLQDDEDLSPESKLALAASALWLGAENAFDNFAEAYGLLEIRFLISDFCRTGDDQQTIRDSCLEEMRKLEGYSPNRILSLLKTLSPVTPLALRAEQMAAQTFQWSDSDNGTRCTGLVPEEYSASHRYPLLIAMPRSGGDLDEALSYWRDQAVKSGFILAVPEIRDSNQNYTASANEHQKFQTVLRQLKTGLSIDTNRVYLVGHGMGGSAAMDLATAFPDTFAAMASVAGLGRKHLNWTVHNASHMPWYIVAGTKQPRYYPRLGGLLEKLFRPAWKGSPQRYHDVIFARYQERGFEQFVDARSEIFQWLNYQLRPASPDRFESKVIRSSDDAAFWVTLDSTASSRFRMEDGSEPTDSIDTTLNVTGYRRGNSYRLTSLPTSAHISVYAELKDFDPDQPVQITAVGSRRKSQEFRINVKDMLDHFRQHFDPSRICLMKIPVSR